MDTAIDSKRDKHWLWGIALLGLALRFAYIYVTRQQPPHPDFVSFLHPALEMAHPFDTSPREPLFVWWLWFLAKLNIVSPAATRGATALWFVPAIFLFFTLARRLTGRRGAWAALLLYTVLPAQIQSDSLGLRHLLETVGVLALLNAVTAQAALSSAKTYSQGALAFASLVLARINYLGSAALILAENAIRSKRFRPLLALLPGIILLLFHFQNNRTKFDDPLHSVNMHTYWFANLEYIGQPGFPEDWDEWQRNPHRASLTFRQWAFERHSPAEFVKESVLGYIRCLWIFFAKVYFASGLPAAATWGLLLIYGAGLLLSLFQREWRRLLLFYSILLWPYAFVSHVFWAGRFFAPFTPLALLFMVLALQRSELFLFPRVRRWIPQRWTGVLPLLQNRQP